MRAETPLRIFLLIFVQIIMLGVRFWHNYIFIKDVITVIDLIARELSSDEKKTSI